MKINVNGITRDCTDSEEKEIQSKREKYAKESLICELKIKLAETDYKAIKYAEGVLSESEYSETRRQREEWRSRINTLENITGA